MLLCVFTVCSFFCFVVLYCRGWTSQDLLLFWYWPSDLYVVWDHYAQVCYPLMFSGYISYRCLLLSHSVGIGIALVGTVSIKLLDFTKGNFEAKKTNQRQIYIRQKIYFPWHYTTNLPCRQGFKAKRLAKFELICRLDLAYRLPLDMFCLPTKSGSLLPAVWFVMFKIRKFHYRKLELSNFSETEQNGTEQSKTKQNKTMITVRPDWAHVSKSSNRLSWVATIVFGQTLFL